MENIFEFGSNQIRLVAEREVKNGNQIVSFSWNDPELTFSEIIESVGELPIPPYLNRKTEESDNTTYQTVYSKIKGSVAAPTAGLHFTPSVLTNIDCCGIDRSEVNLHVGAGTFKPVKSDEINNHTMHTEWISVKCSLVESLLAHNANAIAVGTTSVRTLESLYYMGLKLHKNPNLDEEHLHVSQWEPYEQDTEVDVFEALKCLMDYMERRSLDVINSSTQIIIAPGYEFKIVKMLITNFHQPQSTLLLLVSAFLKGDWNAVYNHALSNEYRFLSYGDSSLLIP